MSEEQPYRIYATHLWELDDDYLRLFEYLGDIEHFYYVNTSDPEAQPDANDPLATRELLRDQIERAEVVVVLAQHYYMNPELTGTQITTAKRHGKKILVIEPFGPDDVPKQLKQLSDHTVEWYARKIVDGIKMLARGEEVARYDSLEWPGEL